MNSKIVTKLAVFCLVLNQVSCLELNNNGVTLKLELLDGSTILSLALDDEERFSGVIGDGLTLTPPENCEGNFSCTFEGDGFNLNVTSVDSGYILTWLSTDVEFQDCFALNASEVNWFGGPEKYEAEWPVETQQFSRSPYTTVRTDNGGVRERYWLNSRGAYIFIDDRVPLFLDQNNIKDDNICFIASLSENYVRRERIILQYVLVAKSDAKEAHLHAVNNYLGKPTGHPDERIIRKPIWTTWAKYKKEINDDVVLAFGQDIVDHGFGGQLEIDDSWETCYGSLIFNPDKFANINNTVQSLKDLGFTVSLWTHPFVNHDCVETMNYGEENDLFVKSTDGTDMTSWWNSNAAHYIDFSREEGRNWFADRVKLLQTLHGIDSFKFDAGESDYPPPTPVISGDVELTPNSITSSYVRTCATFGGLIEVRSASRTQDLPIFVRMEDKDTRWGLDNGLHTLITTLLQLNINGYTLVLPDMIGGNAYGTDVVTAELLARWTQANTFMPAMQFSFLPWEITSDEFDGLAIVKKFVALHEEYADEILKAMDNSITNGTPVNPPIWWVDPTNKDALKVNDEYLLGETILVAPVIQEGATSRDVVLPSGTWKDGNDGTLYEGPQILTSYPAPIDVLPFFIKQ